MRGVILSLLLLALMPLGSASTTTFDLGNYTVGMDYMPLDTEYARADSENVTDRMVRWNWGSFDPGAWTAISIIECHKQPIFNLSDLNYSGMMLMGAMFSMVNRTAKDDLDPRMGLAVATKPYAGIIGSGVLGKSGSKLNTYTGVVNNNTFIIVISNGNDNTFANVLSGLVVTKKEDVPQMRADSIAERLNL